MWSYLSYPVCWKGYVHVLAALALWVFAVILLATEQNNSVMIQIDRAHTYSLNKYPQNFATAFSSIQQAFATYWLPADDSGCMALTNLTPSPTCLSKRTNLVNSVRANTNCDLYYQSPACNCINWVLRGIANDTQTGGGPNRYAGNGQAAMLNSAYQGSCRNISGMSSQFQKALESCHYLYHSSYLAGESGSTIVRRVMLLFLLTTLVTGNAVTYFFLRGPKDWWAVALRIAGMIIWPLLAWLTAISVEFNFGTLISAIVGPPFFILFFYELMADTAGVHDAFINPFFFAEILPVLAAMALVENEVLDFDNILIEILKCHMVSFLYLGVAWFTVKSQDSEHSKAEMVFYTRKAQQEAILISTFLAFLITVNSAMAPYTVAPTLNVLWWLPSVFTIFAFVAILWMAPWDRFKDYESTKLGPGQKRPDESKGYIKNEALYISLAVLALTALACIYFWRDYSLDYHAMWENMPSRSVALNWTNVWLNPSF